MLFTQRMTTGTAKHFKKNEIVEIKIKVDNCDTFLLFTCEELNTLTLVFLLADDHICHIHGPISSICITRGIYLKCKFLNLIPDSVNSGDGTCNLCSNEASM